MSTHLCTQENRLVSAERDLGRLNKAVFFGNGEPSITSQMAVLRKTVAALCWLVAVTCAAVITQIVVLWFKTKGAL